MTKRMSYEDIEGSSKKSIEEYFEVYLDVLEPRFSFEQIAGYDEVKERFRDIVVTPLKYGEALKKAGIQPPTGVIVWGPLGTGRGHLIEASAKEAGVNYLIIRGRECTAQEEVIRRAFEWAREHKPVLVHLMDLDWLAPRRDANYEWSDGSTYGKPDKLGTPEVHRAVHEEIASVAYDPEIFVAASCYRIDVLDQAFTRTSMLGRKIYVPRPSYEDRLAILKYYFSGVALAEDVSLEKLAEETEYYVGWDLESLARKAKLLAIQRASGDGAIVTMEDIRYAMKSVKPWLTPAMARDYDRIRAEDCVHKYNF
jgi:transitional endoplasmic reticulum ATPase